MAITTPQMTEIKKQLFNWKTTAVGIAGAVLLPLLQMLKNGEITYDDLILSGLILFLGWFSKDA